MSDSAMRSVFDPGLQTGDHVLLPDGQMGKVTGMTEHGFTGTVVPVPVRPVAVAQETRCPDCGSPRWHSSWDAILYARCDDCGRVWQHLRRADEPSTRERDAEASRDSAAL